MAKIEDTGEMKSTPLGDAVKAVKAKAVPEWIKCKVNVPNCHVGMIECQIPGNTPDAEKIDAACLAAAKVRGIALNASGKPQFASAPQVEFLES